MHDCTSAMRLSSRVKQAGTNRSGPHVTCSPADTHLSTSRFRHRFSEQVGVRYRRYRMWNRLRAAMRTALVGGTLTDAATAVGSSDSAHFAHNFAIRFGVTPSYVVNRIVRGG
ncbi:MAG: helix-turn-helix domain-containing protein [Betaproteobacteria bacterium]